MYFINYSPKSVLPPSPFSVRKRQLCQCLINHYQRSICKRINKSPVAPYDANNRRALSLGVNAKIRRPAITPGQVHFASGDQVVFNLEGGPRIVLRGKFERERIVLTNTLQVLHFLNMKCTDL